MDFSNDTNTVSGLYSNTGDQWSVLNRPIIMEKYITGIYGENFMRTNVNEKKSNVPKLWEGALKDGHSNWIDKLSKTRCTRSETYKKKKVYDVANQSLIFALEFT